MNTSVTAHNKMGESTPLLDDVNNSMDYGRKSTIIATNDTASFHAMNYYDNERHRLRSTATHDVHTYRQQSRYKCIYIFLEVCILGSIFLMLKIILEKTSAVSSSLLMKKNQSTATRHPSHTFPTFLLTRDHENGEYLNALTNPLYEDMKHAHYISNTRIPYFAASQENNESHHDIPPMILQLSTTQLSYHDNLRISWNTVENDRNTRTYTPILEPIEDTDIIAMYCPASEKDPFKFRDAATIAQVRRTSQEIYIRRNLLNKTLPIVDTHTTTATTTTLTSSPLDLNIDTNAWWIPSFPIVRENTCMFRMWKRIQDMTMTTTTTMTTSSMDPSSMNTTTNTVPTISSSSFILTAQSETLHITHGKEKPTMIHLALTSIPTEMRVHFTTGMEQGIPIVRYGTDRSSLLQTAYGESTTYTKIDLCQEPASIEEPGKFTSPGMLHSIVMSDLFEDTVYFYKVAIMMNQSLSSTSSTATTLNDTIHHSLIWSEIYSFRSPIFPGSNTSFSFVVYADQGVPGYGYRNMANFVTYWTEREVQQNQIRSVHHFGDLSYAQGVGHLWDQWLDMISAFSTSTPLMIGIGNHEYDHASGGENGKDPSGLLSTSGYMPIWGDMSNDSNGECGVPTSKRFIMPSNGNGVFWYSFDYGMVHTIVLSSEHDLSSSSIQYSWLENDLRKVNRQQTPWLVVESHRPMYCSLNSPKDNLVGEAMRREFEHLLYQYKVDLFLAGHYHIYQRSCNGLYQSRCRSGGPTHITIGSAGADLELTSPLLRLSWSASFIRENGYGRISVPNSTALHFEFISNKDGSVKDETWIKK